jgi:F-type H+-transporting ATPase subunit b
VEILHQLGELFLEALPTVILVFLFYLFMRWAFFGPLARVMAERQARTEGARREAEQARVRAQERTQTYQDALKKARGEIYVEQDAARRALLDERAAQIREARAAATERIRAAKTDLEAELASARKELEKATPALAGDIVRSILGPAQPGPGDSREAR